jgi:hypothetical protein
MRNDKASEHIAFECDIPNNSFVQVMLHDLQVLDQVVEVMVDVVSLDDALTMYHTIHDIRHNIANNYIHVEYSPMIMLLFGFNSVTIKHQVSTNIDIIIPIVTNAFVVSGRTCNM